MVDVSSLINRFNLLKRISIFQGLNWFELQRIARKAFLAEYKKGDVICREGDPADFFYCLVSGRLQVYTTSVEGRKDNVDFIHRGMHFGVLSALTGENHSTTFEALNDSIVLKIPKDDFHAILQSMPHLSIRLSQMLSTHIRRNVRGAKTPSGSTVIAVYSPVRGTGSSTYAINLALSLGEETKKKVILINIHSNRNAEPAQKDEACPYWKTPAVDLGDIVDDHETILQNVLKGDLTIDLFHASFDPADTLLKKQIGLFVSAFVGDYHYVVVDLPTEMDEVVLETLTQSDLVHLITFDRKKDLELIHQEIGRLEQTLRDNFREDRVRVIVRALHAKIYLSFEEINQFIDYHVYAALPTIHREELTQMTDSQHLFFLRSKPRSDYTKAVTRIAREIGGVSVGLVLGGGAALGIAHIGVLRVLEEEDIPVDVVAGSSMGAIIAGLWAVGKDSHEIEVLARQFQKRKALLDLLDPVFPLSGLIGGRAIKIWLRKHIGNRTFYTTRVPLKVLAYDLIRREEIVMESGSLVDAIRKSVAIPGVIEPVRENDRLIIDGGVLNPLPTKVLAERGIKKIIAVNVLQSPDDVSEGFDMQKHAEREMEQIAPHKDPWKFFKFRTGRALLRPFKHNISDIIVRTLQATEYVLAEQSARHADVVIHPDLVGINWFELYKVDELIKGGETAAREALPAIKKLTAA